MNDNLEHASYDAFDGLDAQDMSAVDRMLDACEFTEGLLDAHEFGYELDDETKASVDRILDACDFLDDVAETMAIEDFEIDPQVRESIDRMLDTCEELEQSGVQRPARKRSKTAVLRGAWMKIRSA